MYCEVQNGEFQLQSIFCCMSEWINQESTWVLEVIHIKILVLVFTEHLDGSLQSTRIYHWFWIRMERSSANDTIMQMLTITGKTINNLNGTSQILYPFNSSFQRSKNIPPRPNQLYNLKWWWFRTWAWCQTQKPHNGWTDSCGNLKWNLIFFLYFLINKVERFGFSLT